MPLDIRPYEPWMAEQVSALFAAEYGVNAEAFRNQMEGFYEHPFQKGECIRVVALDGKTVAGFQSFFYWPYQWRTEVFRTFQSGNSLVHPHYRGKGIFASLLKFLDTDLQEKQKIDLLMGFPVEASKNSFLRNGWNNILDLQWYVKPISYLSVLWPGRANLSDALKEKTSSFPNVPSLISLKEDSSFREWRTAYQPESAIRYFEYTSGSEVLTCSVKSSVRKKVLKELIIGDIRTNSDSPHFLAAGMNALERSLKKRKDVTFLSIAINPNEKSVLPGTLKELNFKPIDRKIYFIVKNFRLPAEVMDPTNWRLFRSDIDTW